MPDLFTFEEQIHHGGDPACPGCVEDYPERCGCGGLIHASEVTLTDADADVPPATQCDRCGRSKGDLEEQVA
jgi:hypothetical protein